MTREGAAFSDDWESGQTTRTDGEYVSMDALVFGNNAPEETDNE